MKSDRCFEDHRDKKLHLEFKDRIAIILAAWWMILPWGLLITAIYAIILMLFDKAL